MVASIFALGWSINGLAQEEEKQELRKEVRVEENNGVKTMTITKVPMKSVMVWTMIVMKI